MNLPGSRNTTYGASSDVLSADLNAIQDCIIGGKYGNQTLVIPAAEFASIDAPGNPITFNFPVWQDVGAVRCGLRIPVGTQIVSVEWFHDRGGAGTLTYSLNHYDMVAGLSVGLDTYTQNAGTGLTSSGVRAVGYTMPAAMQLNVTAAHTNVANKLYGVQFVLTRL